MTEQKPNPAALAAVREKRGEIVGIIAELERQIASHRSDLLHIDYTLRLLDPAFTVGEARTKRIRFTSKGYFEKGELTRRIYDGLRRSETVSAAELADAAMADKKLTDRRVRTHMVTRILSRLGHLAADGKLVRVRVGVGTYNVRWKLAG
jgi:hypothetical protein